MYNLNRNLTLFIKPFIWLVIIAVLCLMPGNDLPRIPLSNLPQFDKLVHFMMYFILALLLVKPLRRLQLPVWVIVLVISVLIGGLIEILQYAITNLRSASWFDFFADIAGTITGLLTYGMLVAGKWWERYF
jgi:VanZ family protein